MNLGEDVIVYVFFFLDKTIDVFTLRAVCKRWKSAIDASTLLWANIIFRDYGYNPNTINVAAFKPGYFEKFREDEIYSPFADEEVVRSKREEFVSFLQHKWIQFYRFQQNPTPMTQQVCLVTHIKRVWDIPALELYFGFGRGLKINGVPVIYFFENPENEFMQYFSYCNLKKHYYPDLPFLKDMTKKEKNERKVYFSRLIEGTMGFLLRHRLAEGVLDPDISEASLFNQLKDVLAMFEQVNQFSSNFFNLSFYPELPYLNRHKEASIEASLFDEEVEEPIESPFMNADNDDFFGNSKNEDLSVIWMSKTETYPEELFPFESYYFFATKPKKAIIEERIQYYCHQIKELGKQPIILVLSFAQDTPHLIQRQQLKQTHLYIILDGHHKLEAYLRLGKRPAVLLIEWKMLLSFDEEVKNYFQRLEFNQVMDRLEYSEPDNLVAEEAEFWKGVRNLDYPTRIMFRPMIASFHRERSEFMLDVLKERKIEIAKAILQRKGVISPPKRFVESRDASPEKE